MVVIAAVAEEAIKMIEEEVIKMIEEEAKKGKTIIVEAVEEEVTLIGITTMKEKEVRELSTEVEEVIEVAAEQIFTKHQTTPKPLETREKNK